MFFVADAMFNFTCFNVEDPEDPRVGLVNGELSIPGILLRREVFDPVVNQVLYLSSFFALLVLGGLLRVLCTAIRLKPCYWAGTGTHRGTNEETKPTHRRPPSRGRLLRKRILVQKSRSQWCHHTFYDAPLVNAI